LLRQPLAERDLFFEGVEVHFPAGIPIPNLVWIFLDITANRVRNRNRKNNQETAIAAAAVS
jgi:hypothetical protein